MLVTFSFSCILEQGEVEQKIADYIMVGNVHPTVASQLLQQILIMDAIRKTKEESQKKEE